MINLKQKPIKERAEDCSLFLFNINTIYYLYMNMVQKYDEFFSEDVQLNEAQEKMINEAAEVIAEKIRNGEEVDEGLFGSLVGGLAAVLIHMGEARSCDGMHDK